MRLISAHPQPDQIPEYPSHRSNLLSKQTAPPAAHLAGYASRFIVASAGASHFQMPGIGPNHYILGMLDLSDMRYNWRWANEVQRR